MTSQKKRLITIFTVVFIFSYIAVNWNTVSWIFNYREVSGLAYDFFNPYQESGNILLASTTNPEKTIQTPGYYSLLIPRIGMFTPVVLAQSINKKALENDLDMGAVYYPGSVLPGQNGQIVILGHSAPPNWPYAKHDWVFSNIENLSAGDKIVLTFNGTNYTYLVTEKNIIQRGQELSINSSAKTNTLTLVSCWPPGKDYQRIAVQAELLPSTNTGLKKNISDLASL